VATVAKSMIVHHTQQEMFRLVDEVEHYPEFLPWCGGAEVLERDDRITRATLHIDYYHIKQDFTTENLRDPPASIDIRLVRGPFHNLEGCWRFIPLGEQACKIQFRLHYEFSSMLLDTVIGPVFQYIANTFVDAFVKRAQQVYGAQGK
jgi:ribosome-associated toxin RatA of RatAB toxin-antitoxin module